MTVEPLFFVRDMLPRDAFFAIQKLDQLRVNGDTFDKVTRCDLFPTADEITALDREFGLPLSRLPSAQRRPESRDREKELLANQQFDNGNTNNNNNMVSMDDDNDNLLIEPLSAPKQERNFIRDNIDTIWEMSKRVARRKPPMNCVIVECAGHYSTQAINPVEIAKNHIRKNILKKNELSGYSHRVFTQIDVGEERSAKEKFAKSLNLTPSGWLEHTKLPELVQPDPHRREEISNYRWAENENNTEYLNPPLRYRDAFPWEARRTDWDVWSKPVIEPTPFPTFPRGDVGDQLAKMAEEQDQHEWKAKLCGPEQFKSFRKGIRSEHSEEKRWSSNQIDKLRPLLKDKLKTRQFNAAVLPSLSVLNEGYDDTRNGKAFAPVAYNHWLLNDNVARRYSPIGQSLHLYNFMREASTKKNTRIDPDDFKPLVYPIE